MQFPVDMLKKCCFLAGPTACGKTAVGLAIAERLSAEIVSMDSMAIYRRMDIGTAKASLPEQQRVPHHLIDIVEPHLDFSVADYLTAAQQACSEIISRGHTPLFVGGTALYLRSLLRGTFDGPPADWEFRHRLQHELQRPNLRQPRVDSREACTFSGKLHNVVMISGFSKRAR